MRMKFLFAGLLLLLVQSSINAQSSITKKLIGKWEATDAAKEVGSFEFLDSVNIIMTIPDQSVPPGTYTIDTTKKSHVAGYNNTRRANAKKSYQISRCQYAEVAGLF
jgi:hypothetical protein